MKNSVPASHFVTPAARPFFDHLLPFELKFFWDASRLTIPRKRWQRGPVRRQLGRSRGTGSCVWDSLPIVLSDCSYRDRQKSAARARQKKVLSRLILTSTHELACRGFPLDPWSIYFILKCIVGNTDISTRFHETSVLPTIRKFGC